MSPGEPGAKKAKLDGDAEQKALEAIDAVQNEIDKINEQASEEILKVEQKYNKLRKPFYDKRGALIVKVPKFWAQCLINHPQTSAILDYEEAECLEYVTNMEVEEFEDIKSGYRIKLMFRENPYLENEEIVKEFNLGRAEPTSTATEIIWKEGMNLQLYNREKDPKRKGRAPGRVTFFHWFCDTDDPTSDDIAEIIKDDVWPNPLQFYLLRECHDESDTCRHGDDDEGCSRDDDVECLEEDAEDGEEGGENDENA